MNDIWGIPVKIIRPGDWMHPGDDKIYIINLLEVKKALDDLRPDFQYNPFAWKAQFDIDSPYFGIRGAINASSR